MNIKFSRVRKEDVPSAKRFQRGKYSRFFEELMDMAPGLTACISVDSRGEGHLATQALNKIAKQEGLELGWSRNREATAFYYWLERPKAQIKRIA